MGTMRTIYALDAYFAFIDVPFGLNFTQQSSRASPLN